MPAAMRPKFSVYIATSLDGFIARANGDIAWLTDIPAPDGEDYGYHAFISTVDVLVMGRHTYEKVLTFDKWPYPVRVVVLTSRPTDLAPAPAGAAVEALSLAPAELAVHLGDAGVKHVYVDGGVTIQRFLAADLVDELTLTSVPILLGAGIPLFGPLARDIRLTHQDTRAWANGLVQSKYAVARAEPR
jgi:dihydrofolate reductase